MSKRPVSPLNGQPVPNGKKFATGDERTKEMARRGGIATKQKKTLAEIMTTAFNAPANVSDNIKEQIALVMGIQPEEVSNAVVMTYRQIFKAFNGDTQAFVVSRDTAGQKPQESVVVSTPDATVMDEVRAYLAKADGTVWTGYTQSKTAPENPTNGMEWLDTSTSPPVMKVYAESSGLWAEQSTTYVAVSATGIGKGIAENDAVTVAGLKQNDLNGSWVIASATDDTIVYTGILAATITQTATVTVDRKCPDMDFVVEHNNRLWGCSSKQHEIYSCALGDPTNWERYAGLSTDSYAVTVGSSGDFTGAHVINSSVVFAKENCMHKIYGTMPSNYQTTVEHFRGVESGSGRAMVRVEEYLYYKSVFDVCVYDGSEVQTVSRALGVHKYKHAVAGVNDRRLYISMEDDAGVWTLFVLDTATGLWAKEDNVHALCFARCLTETFMLTADGKIYALKPGAYNKDFFMIGSDYDVHATPEDAASIPWMAETGELLENIGDNKHVSKIQVLLEPGEGAKVKVEVARDGEAYQEVMTISGGEKRRYTLPIYPRRCDRIKIRLSGTGAVRLINFGKVVEAGSEYGR